MHLCRFDRDRLGVVENGKVYDVTAAIGELPAPGWPGPPGDPLIVHLDLVMRQAKGLLKSAESRPLSDVSLYSPITSPTKVIAAPANYRLHLTIDAKDPEVHHNVHVGLDKLERPVDKLGLFLKATSSIVGPAEGVTLKWPERRSDHEVELAIVIGRGGKGISKADAFAHVAGYMIGLDISVRGTEDRSYRKSIDSYTVLGPWLTTADEIRGPEDLTIWLEVNGEPRQRSSTSVMIVGIAELIEMASNVYALHPGDVIMTGTPEGVSRLNAGDVMRCGCDGIGEMTVPVL